MSPKPTTARAVLDAIGAEFNELRADNKVKAWKVYQQRLMENFGILCEVMTPKDITELSMKIEENLKDTSGTGGSPLDEVRLFLTDGAVH
jgi:hypothetical protein